MQLVAILRPYRSNAVYFLFFLRSGADLYLLIPIKNCLRFEFNHTKTKSKSEFQIYFSYSISKLLNLFAKLI